MNKYYIHNGDTSRVWKIGEDGHIEFYSHSRKRWGDSLFKLLFFETYCEIISKEDMLRHTTITELIG